jgi:hypothetical protein
MAHDDIGVREEIMGFWSFGTDREWSQESGGELDRALSAFKEMAEAYGDQFQVIVVDLKEEAPPLANKTPMSKIQIRVVVNPPNPDIENRLRELGLIYAEE